MIAQSTALDAQLTLREVLAALAGAFRDPLPVPDALELVGLDSELDTRVQALSGGQQRRGIWPLPSSVGRRCCSSTNQRPVSIRRAAGDLADH